VEVEDGVGRVVEASSYFVLVRRVVLVELEFLGVEFYLVVKLHEFFERHLRLVLSNEALESEL